MTEEGSPGDSVPTRRPGRFIAIGILALVGMLVAVAGGFLLGRSTAPGPAIVVTPGPVLQQSPLASSLPVSGALPSSPPTRPGLTVPASGGAPPAVFSAAQDLIDTPTVASGYRLTRGQVDGESLAGTLADSFAVVGDVSPVSTGWQVGDPSNDASSSLVVADDPLMTWQFEDKSAAADSAAGVSISQQEALDVATALLSGIGVDVGTVDWQVDRFADLTRVTAWQTLKGARTQLAWRVGVGQAGAVVNASGFAAGLVEIPGYPVVGAATAVRRASLPTWATLGPRPFDEAASAVSPTATPSTGSTLNASGRPSLRVPMTDVVVTAADLGLAQFWQPDGDLLILPAYRLTGEDGSQWSLIGVSGVDVHFVNVPYPSVSPSAP